MNIFSISDRVFEEAGRDPDGYEKLLAKLRRERAGIFWILVGVFAILILGLGWVCYTYSTYVFSPSFISGKEPPLVTWWTANSRGVYMALGSAFIPFFAIQGMSLFRLDAQVKLLLFLRAQRSIERDAPLGS